MKNIIKAQYYKIIKKKSLLLFFGVLLFGYSVVFNFLVLTSQSGQVSYAIAKNASLNTIFLLFWTVIVAVMMYSEDIDNKTIFLEISTGKSRFDEIVGRFLAAFIISVIGAIAIFIVPLLISLCLFEFGDAITPASIVIKAFLLIFVIFNYCAFVILILTLFSGKKLGVILPVYMSMFPVLIQDGFPFANIKCSYLGFISIGNLMNYKSYSIYTLNNLNYNSIYYSDIEPEFVISLIGGSIIGGIVFLAFSYFYFRKIDY